MSPMLTSRQLYELLGITKTQAYRLFKACIFREIFGPDSLSRSYRFQEFDVGIAMIGKCLLIDLGLSTELVRPLIKGISREDLIQVAKYPENLYMVIVWKKGIPVVEFKSMPDESREIDITFSRMFDWHLIVNLDPRKNYHV